MIRIASIIISLLVSFSLFAQSTQTYQIKNLNTQTIEIGGKQLKVGDRFKSTSKIKWASNRQVMEAIDSEKKEIHVFSATALKSKKADNVADYLVNINHASTRDLNSLSWTITRSINSDKFTNRRIALLIANTNYFCIPKLINPMYDCNALSDKLLELGFDVYTAFDCASSQLRDVVINFSKAADDYDLALFFYSGHGVQESGQNYLIPVNLRLDDVSELNDCVKCEFVRNQLDKSKCANRIILFDACRSQKTWSRDVSNAWGQMEGSLGTYISFSTKSGKTADDGNKKGNSPYTIALLKCISAPNRELTLVMGDVVRETAKITNNIQEPTGSGNFRNDLFLNLDLPPSPSISNIGADSDLLVDQADKLYKEEKYKEAFQLYSQAAAQNNVKAAYYVGDCYYSGVGVSQDYAKAVEWFHKSADQGNAAAQCNLGYCYRSGVGVPQDYAKAVEWYRKAAEQGFVTAQYNLGVCYYNGRGVKQDYAKAVEWYQKSAEQGYAASQCNLGVCYEYGQGVTQNNDKAIVWYRKSAEQGYAVAQNNLGYCYEKGRGVPQDYEQAVKWYRQAAEQGDADAQCSLGYCFYYGLGVPQDYEQAVKWYNKAARQDYATAQNNLGNCFYYGLGVPQDYTKAVAWFLRAARQGDSRAQNNLGVCYEYGQGVPQNKDKAIVWYRKAAEQNYPPAEESLKRLGEL
jgi:TPR repeat protein